MENYELNSLEEKPEIHIPDACVPSVGFDWEKANIFNQKTEVLAMEEDENEESLADLMVWDSGSKLVRSGFTNPCSTGRSFTHLSQSIKKSSLGFSFKSLKSWK